MNFVVFDKGIKKGVCRYNQYFGIKRTQQRLNNSSATELHDPNRGYEETACGILGIHRVPENVGQWYGLLSGFCTHWAELNARVLIVTDRDELDEQIEKTFTGVDEKIVRTKSGGDLLNRLECI